MREIYTKIDQLKNMINDIQDEKYNKQYRCTNKRNKSF